MNGHRFLIVCFFLLSIVTACKEKTNTKDNLNASAPTESLLSHSDSVLADLKTKILKEPRNAALFHERAKIYFAQKNFSYALGDMKTALEIDSTRPAFFLTLADLYLVVGKSGNSKAALEKCLSLDPKNTEANLKLAELYLFVRNHSKSIEYIDKVLQYEEHNPRAYFMKGMNFKESGDTAKAISSFRTAIDQQSDYYDAFMQLGILFQIKKNPLALQYYNSALALRPRSVEVLYGRSMFYQETANYNRALEGYNMILQLEPCNKNAHFNLGYINQEYLKVYKQAIIHYSNAIHCDSLYADAFMNRGLCFEALGNIGASKEDYLAAEKINPAMNAASEGLKRIH